MKMKGVFISLFLVMAFSSLLKAKTWEVPAGSIGNKITIEAEFPADVSAISCRIVAIPEFINYIMFSNDVNNAAGRNGNPGAKSRAIQRISVMPAQFKSAAKQIPALAITRKYQLYFDVDEGRAGQTGLLYLRFSDSSGRAWDKSISIKVSPSQGQTAASAENIRPMESKLLVCGPNPFKTKTEIRYTLARKEMVRLAVYDIQGRQIRSLFRGTKEPGTMSLGWDGRDQSGRLLPSGIYFINIEAGGYSATVKAIYLK